MPALNPASAAVARRRHGVLTRSEALGCGVSPEQLRRAVERGELDRLHPGVYRIAGAPITWHQRLLIGVLASGPGALASHRSAAVLWDLDSSWKGRPEIVAQRHRRSRFDDVRRHESKDLDRAGATTREGIPCTGLERTLLDLGAVVPLERVQPFVDDAIRRGLCSWDDLLHTLATHSRQGRRGCGPMRSILESCYGTTVPDSRFNRLVERLLADSKAGAPVVEYEVRTADGRFVARVDLAYPALKIAIELDSRRHHLGVDAFESDRQRQNRLELEGWLVLRFTWRTYMDTPWRIVAEVAAAIAARRGATH
ncbi:MAG: type IV toxin-antitoxin system AbiEi family antitoxin domain-containing protein [Acidimicrobiales bacterium]